MSKLDDIFKRDQVNRSIAEKETGQIYSWALIAGLILSMVCMVILFG